MNFTPLKIQDKSGRTILLRRVQLSDADKLIKYLKETAGESKYLLREPDEIQFTQEQEESFISMVNHAEKSLMLIAIMGDVLVGTCSFMNAAPTKKSAHRCEVAIALYQEFCGYGIGKQMMEILLQFAKRAGYQQAELEVVEDNQKAVMLYQKLGFKTYGILPKNMKYTDGSYANMLWMMKEL